MVYHFFDAVHMRFEMAVVEMYEQGASELTPWALAFHPRNDTHSSFEPVSRMKTGSVELRWRLCCGHQQQFN